MIYKLCLTLLLCFVTVSVHSDNRMVGKTFSFKWTIQSQPVDRAADRIELRFCDGSHLVWSEHLSADQVVSGKVPYDLSEVEPGILQLVWEQDNSGIDEVMVVTLNLYKWSVYGVVVSGGEVNITAGAFSYSDEISGHERVRSCDDV